MIIKIRGSMKDGFGEPIREIFDVLNTLTKHDESETIIIDLSECTFIHPFILIGLKLIQNQYITQGYRIEFNINCSDKGVENYISTICFPNCLKPIDYEGQRDLIDKYSNKSYIPLVSYDTLNSNRQNTSSFGLISLVDKLLKEQLKLPQNILSGLRYLVDEAQDNVREHSNSQDGYIIAQFFREKGYLDLCIADEGHGILGSYQRNGNYPNVLDDLTAIKFAVEGKSTKGKERGYGISTSIKLLTEGLKGNYFLWSGKAFFYNNKVHGTASLPINRLGGTILFLRIPVYPNSEFHYNNFVE